MLILILCYFSIPIDGVTVKCSDRTVKFLFRSLSSEIAKIYDIKHLFHSISREILFIHIAQTPSSDNKETIIFHNKIQIV